jgi:rhodanese-related sulfurtransferase
MLSCSEDAGCVQGGSGVQHGGSSVQHLVEAIKATDCSSVVVTCRQGNDSQVVVQQLLESGVSQARDLAGGMHAWARDVDPNMAVL